MASALLLLSAGVNVTFIFTFTRANIIDGSKSLHMSLHLRNDGVVVSFSVFMGVVVCLWMSVGVYGCLWVCMGVYECLWVFMGPWVYIGI